MSARAATAVLIAIVIAAAAGTARASDIDSAIRAKQAQIGAAHGKLAQKRNQLGAARTRVASLQSQLAETDANIVRVGANLEGLQAQVHSNERRLAWNQRQLSAAKASLSLHSDALRRRMVDAYERGDVSYLNVLLASTSFGDLVERWEDIRLLIDANQKTVRERQDAQRRVATVERSLEGAQAQLDASVAQAQQTRLALQGLDSQRRQLVAVADGQRRQIAGEVKQLEEFSASEEAGLQSLIVERQKAEEAAREAARRTAGLAGETPEPSAGGGSFSWPASGPITSPFGYRADPYGSGGSDFHPGIDIAAPMGSTITAAADGRVIFAGWYGGYGNAVIIDHGGGVSTLYGHCSQLFVSEHQDIQKGQAIAAVGSTGHSTGPHVHFEVRVNGSPVDPISRLR